jgi:hypothetical protein
VGNIVLQVNSTAAPIAVEKLALKQEPVAIKPFNANIPGVSGVTPHIQDGYWYIGEINTGVRAEALDGKTYQLVVDDHIFSEGVNLIAGENVSLIPNTTENSIKIESAPDKTFVFTQAVASKEWIIPHPLHKYPNVTFVDSAGSIVIGEISYLSLDLVVGTFSAEFGGRAYLN